MLAPLFLDLIADSLVQALTAWFYPGQPEVEFMLECSETIAEAIAGGSAEEAAAEGIVEHAARAFARIF